MIISQSLTLGISEIEITYLQAIIDSINESADMAAKREEMNATKYEYKEF